MIKKFISFILMVLLTIPNVAALNISDVSAECAVVISEQSGEILFQKNAHKRHSMASTTKIMTSLLAIESGKLLNEVRITDDMLKVEGTSMGLLSGDSVSLDELVHGMLLQSGNDAANATAIYLSGSLLEFSDLMNFRAKQIGMNNTNFVTPSGLDSEEHYSTAYDMALLGREAVSNTKFLSVCSKPNASLTYGNPPYLRTLYNHNKLLDYYDYALGIKTGFTKKSGRCLVSYAFKDGIGLIAVTLNAPDDWQDHKLMLDYGFDSLISSKIIADLPSDITVVGGKNNRLNIVTDSFVYSSLDSFNIEYKIFLNKFVYAPIRMGDIVGFWRIYVDGDLVKEIPITAAESIV